MKEPPHFEQMHAQLAGGVDRGCLSPSGPACEFPEVTQGEHSWRQNSGLGGPLALALQGHCYVLLFKDKVHKQSRPTAKVNVSRRFSPSLIGARVRAVSLEKQPAP